MKGLHKFHIIIKAFVIALCTIICTPIQSQETAKEKNIYIIKLHKEIDKSSAKMFTDALKEAVQQQAD